MGGDGGTALVSRKDIRAASNSATLSSSSSTSAGVSNVSASSEKDLDEKEKVSSKVLSCSISGDVLKEPVVACRMGQLMNKDVLIEKVLLEKSKTFEHIKSLKDVSECKFTLNPRWRDTALYKSNKTTPLWVDPSTGTGKYMCPYTQIDFNGTHPFSIMWETGMVISDKALVNIPNLNPNNEQHIVKLFPQTTEEIERAKLWIEEIKKSKMMMADGSSSKKKKKSKSSSSSSTAGLGKEEESGNAFASAGEGDITLDAILNGNQSSSSSLISNKVDGSASSSSLLLKSSEDEEDESTLIHLGKNKRSREE